VGKPRYTKVTVFESISILLCSDMHLGGAADKPCLHWRAQRRRRVHTEVRFSVRASGDGENYGVALEWRLDGLAPFEGVRPIRRQIHVC